MTQASLDLIEAMQEIVEECQPITGRGVGYKLFTRGLIPSMGVIKYKTKNGQIKKHHPMRQVYRLLLKTREDGLIPWDGIVDETRELERVATWDDPAHYVRCVARSYRRDFWLQQPKRVQVWSEKGTVRGVLQPLLDEYGVGFLPVHGFSGATPVHDIAVDNDGRRMIALYVGDFDPSGMCMSERDLPERLERYDGFHVSIERVALIEHPSCRQQHWMNSKFG